MTKISVRIRSIVLAAGGFVAAASSSAFAADCYTNTVTNTSGGNSPIRYWRLGEASGTAAIDQIGGANGVYMNSVGLGAAGTLLIQGDTAAAFSGSNFVDVSSAPIASNLASHTVEAWFNASVVDGQEHIIYSEDVADGTVFQVRIGSSDKLEYGIYGSTSWNFATGATTIVPGVWYYVAATLDPVNGMKLYIWDGGSIRVDGTNPNTTPSTEFVAISAEIGAGRYAGGAIFTPFKGTIDEVAIHNVALSSVQLGQRIIDRIPRITSSPENLLMCPTGAFSLAVTATSADMLSYQWRIGGTPIEGATGSTLNIGPNDVGVYDCVVSTSCGVATSAAAEATSCPGDFNCSGFTPDTEDIDAFFTAWLAGDASADVNGSGFTPDTEDIDYFFTRWLAGC
jgi:hypothetical protein